MFKKLATLTLLGIFALPSAILGEEGPKVPSIRVIEAGAQFGDTQYKTEDLNPEDRFFRGVSLAAIGVCFLFYKLIQLQGCENAGNPDNGWGGDLVDLVNDCN
jgi:hypothetical protein